MIQRQLSSIVHVYNYLLRLLIIGLKPYLFVPSEAYYVHVLGSSPKLLHSVLERTN